MTAKNKRQSVKEGTTVVSADNDAKSNAWLFLEHVTPPTFKASSSSTDIAAEADSKENAAATNEQQQQQEKCVELKAPLSTVVTFFVLKFAKVSCPFLKTVFLNKRRDDGCNKDVGRGGGEGSSFEEEPASSSSSSATADISLKISQEGRVFVSGGPEFTHPELEGLSGSFSCQLPAVYLPDQRLWITGLCSVIRYVLLNFGNEAAKSLLGHNQTTLSAPAEVSVWTKFCEIDLPKATSSFLKNLVKAKEGENCAISGDSGEIAHDNFLQFRRIHLPEELAKYEAHLRQPIRMHNIRKRMQAEKFVGSNISNTDAADGGGGGKGDPIIEFARSQHKFAEGPDCLLSDAILFIHYFLMDREADGVSDSIGGFDDLLGTHLPLTCQWFHRVLERMKDVATSLLLVTRQQRRRRIPPSSSSRDSDNSSSNHDCSQSQQICNDLKRFSLGGGSSSQDSEEVKDQHQRKVHRFELELPTVKNQSLYVSDPARVNPASRSFTRPGAIDGAMKWFESSGIDNMDSSSAPSVFDLDGVQRLSWDELPDLIHPLHGGQLPPERADKKCHQLENIALAVIDLVKRRKEENVTVVDFCCGGGHLAILLAYLLPKSTFILVENKAESLQRAVERTKKLGLTNCHFFQGNMDYFTGSFDIGVSVHACGVATDLVLKMCVDNMADFVSCPCCYGKVQENHMLSYPRSQSFVTKKATFENYVVIGHTADQTHFTNDKHEQGTYAMDIIDTDRLHMALEAGYKRVLLTKLRPLECTPKNNLLIGQYC